MDGATGTESDTNERVRAVSADTVVAETEPAEALIWLTHETYPSNDRIWVVVSTVSGQLPDGYQSHRRAHTPE